MSSQFVNTTLCYIRSNGSTLMLKRMTNDAMHGMWIAPGGKFEAGEMPEECVIREVREETGLELTKIHLRGILTFVQHRADDAINTSTCFVFESFSFCGEILSVGNQDIRWVNDAEIVKMNLPASDHIFTPWIYEGTKFFSAKFSAGLKHVAFYE